MGENGSLKHLREGNSCLVQYSNATQTQRYSITVTPVCADFNAESGMAIELERVGWCDRVRNRWPQPYA
jgi:hypothetical protein